MGSETSFFECPRCGQGRVSLKRMKTLHSPKHPHCVTHKWQSWMYEQEMRPTGRDQAVLDAAGLTRELPIGIPYLWADGGKRDYMLIFYAVAPIWAIELCRRLQQDQMLIKKLGGRKTLAGSGYAWVQKRLTGEWPPIVKIKGEGTLIEKYVKYELPIERRIRVLKVAASSPMAREMLHDDLEAAMLIIRDAI